MYFPRLFTLRSSNYYSRDLFQLKSAKMAPKTIEFFVMFYLKE